ncbi:ATP-binding protein [Candidatus Cloacimonadota bacterium]
MKTKEDQHTFAMNNDLIKEYYKISHQILLFASKKVSTEVFLKESFKGINNSINCEILELWLRNKDGQYYAKYNTKFKPKYYMEKLPQKNKFNFKKKYKNHDKFIEQCINVVSNNSELSENDSPNSSYFCNDASFKLGKNNIKSYAIISINNNFKRQGLLILYCPQKNKFNQELIEMLENVAQSLSIALNHLHTQMTLNERVKEFTCLYGIAQLGENTELSLDKILQKIVELLPAAWQYPKLAAARIVLDGKYYTSPNFFVNSRKQSSNILITGVKRGLVEVTYLESVFGIDESPFLQEEQNLLDVVSREVAVIVERRIAYEEKEKLENQLRHADRLATIGQLSAGVAHELNEPLANILGFAQLMQKNDNFTKQENEDLKAIVNASLHAREIIKKLMLFSRQMPTQKTKVNLNQLIENGLYFLMSRCEKNGIEVSKEFSDDIREIVADSSQLYQVLVNLVVNAIQAMPNGGKLSIKTQTSHQNVSFSVEDTGIGMSDEILKQIFIPFFTTKDISEGTGLGLPVVHGIVSSHNGSIKVESKVDIGTKFEVILPAQI